MLSGIGDALTLGDLADEPLAFLRKGDDGRGRPRTFLVHDDRRLPAFHDGDDRVGRAQIDSDDLAHLIVVSPVNRIIGSI